MNIIQKFNEFFSKNLNKPQQKAVTHSKGPLLIIAGAGSGKTRVITARILNLLLNEQVNPQAIIALTFTNKAAKEMQERVTHFLGEEAELPFIGTFHGYCLRLLKKHQELLDNPFFSILDEDDKEKLLHALLQKNGLQKEMTAKNLSYQISQIKNRLIDEEYLQELQAAQPLLYGLYKAYEKDKKASKNLDFDDLLLEVLSLLEHNPSFKKSMQESVYHILVDEYQDTNMVQHTLLKHLALSSKNSFAIDSLCVVGDEDQSIYSWRGATIANIINFKKDFTRTTTIKIEQNYRSVQPILSLANEVISQNKERNPKELWSEKEGKDRIRQLACLSEYQEGDVIATFVKSLQQKKSAYATAILYRAHYQSRAIEEALIKSSIPYKIIGGVQFYERKEIKDFLAYLKLVVNPFDRASFFRVINVPARGLGAKFEELFFEHWHTEPLLTYHDIATKLLATREITGTKKEAVEEFLALFKSLHATSKPSTVIEHFIARTSYLSYLKETYDTEDAQSRIDNIKELINAIKHFETQGVATIENFLYEVALMQELLTKNDEQQAAVLLMTLHGAKGLEFDGVVLAGLEDGLLPSSRSLGDQAALEEERRLFYVGITRAKEYLLITRSRYRNTYRGMNDQMSSRFLKDSAQLSYYDDCSYWKPYEIQAYLSKWLGMATKETGVRTFSSATVTENKKTGHVSRETVITKPGLFKPNQPVNHATFGVGIVQNVEVKGDGGIYITARFKTGVKKVDSKFLKQV